ncbi:MAG: hypothetical protein ACRDYY_07180 [Acidimicrobiales bacterium]
MDGGGTFGTPRVRHASGGLAGPAGDIAMLLAHRRGEPRQPLLEALLDFRSGGAPAAIQEAADRVVRRHAPWGLDIAGAAQAVLAAAGDERAVRAFCSSTLEAGGSRRSFAQVASAEGICHQYAGKLVQLVGSRIRSALRTAPAPLPWTVATLQARAGTVTTGAHLDDVLATLGVTASPERELIVWLAGPYATVPGHSGWVAAQPGQVASRTAQALRPDGGVRRIVDVEAELADLRIHPDWLPLWLGACGGVPVHDVVVSTRGPLADVAERILDASGCAVAPDEIVALVERAGRHVGGAAAANALRGRRFRRDSDGRIALSSWGEPRMETAPRKSRPAKVSPRRQPRRASGSTAPAPPPRAGSRLWLWVRVDENVLHGCEADVPVALVEGLGLVPPARRTFSSRWGPVTLAHDGLEPKRGSVRAVALAAGARAEDTLMLGFSADGEVEVDLRRSAGQAATPGDSFEPARSLPEVTNESNIGAP